MKYVLIAIAVLLAGIALGIIIRIVMYPVNTANKLIDTAYQAQDKTLNADNAIYNYEWFKQQYEDIKASKKQLDNARKSYESFTHQAGARDTWTFEDKNEDARLRSVILGIENNLEAQIATYNARTKMANRAIFQDNIVPDYIDALTFIKK